MTGAAAAFVAGGSGLAFSVAVSPSAVSAYGNTGAAANLTTGTTIATPAGGVAPYTYAWAQVGTSPYTWTIGSAATASTGFTVTSLGAGNTAIATFEVTVTDSLGGKAVAQVTATANNGQPYSPAGSFTGREGESIP